MIFNRILVACVGGSLIGLLGFPLPVTILLCFAFGYFVPSALFPDKETKNE